MPPRAIASTSRSRATASRPRRVAIVPSASSARLAVASSPPASASRSTPRRSSSARSYSSRPINSCASWRRSSIGTEPTRIAAPNGSAFTTPATPPASTSAPSGTSRRSTASAIDPYRRRHDGGGHPPDLLLAEARPPPRPAGGASPGNHEPAHPAVRMAAIVQPGDRLLPRVAALAEADRALVQPCLRRHRVAVELATVARDAGLDARRLPGRLVAAIGRRLGDQPVGADRRVQRRQRIVGVAPDDGVRRSARARPCGGTASARAWPARRRGATGRWPAPAHRRC